MQCDEGIIFYHVVKEGQGTRGRVNLISLLDLGEGDTAAVPGISGRDQKPIVQNSQSELAPLDIFAHRGMEVAPLAETLCYEFEVSC